jgi:hypothetical protein
VVSVLERGDIRFFWRPVVRPAVEQPRDPLAPVASSVAAFYMLLSQANGTHRRVRIGKKRLPTAKGQRFWARVERVGTFGRAIGGLLDDETYETKTRGERLQPGARMAACGTYEIVQHDDHCHLVYRIDMQDEDDAPAEVLVPETGNHVVLFENTGPGRAVWTATGGPALLDEEGAECVLLGISEEEHAFDDLSSPDSSEPSQPHPS